MENELIAQIAHTDPVVHATAMMVHRKCRLLYHAISVGADREFRDYLLEQFAKFNLERNREIAWLRDEVMRLKMAKSEPVLMLQPPR